MSESNLYFAIELTARQVRRYGQAILDKHQLGITVEQWLVLKVVAENEGINQLGVGEQLARDKPTISRMIRSLVREGLVEKSVSAADKREFILQLSAKGRQWIDQHLPVIESIRLQGLSGLDESDVQTTMQLLLQIRNNLNL